MPSGALLSLILQAVYRKAAGAPGGHSSCFSCAPELAHMSPPTCLAGGCTYMKAVQSDNRRGAAALDSSWSWVSWMLNCRPHAGKTAGCGTFKTLDTKVRQSAWPRPFLNRGHPRLHSEVP